MSIESILKYKNHYNLLLYNDYTDTLNKLKNYLMINIYLKKHI